MFILISLTVEKSKLLSIYKNKKEGMAVCLNHLINIKLHRKRTAVMRVIFGTKS